MTLNFSYNGFNVSKPENISNKAMKRILGKLKENDCFTAQEVIDIVSRELYASNPSKRMAKPDIEG